MIRFWAGRSREVAPIRRWWLVSSVTVALVALLNLAAAEGQPGGKVPRIGVLVTSLTIAPHMLEAFRQRLRDLGYVEGRNVMIEYRDAEGKLERLPDLAAELVGLQVDVILTAGSIQALAAKQATRIIPIVFATAGDPVGTGLVTSLSRPGAISRGCPASPRSLSASAWSCSSRPFRGSVESRSSGRRAASADTRKRT